MVLNEKILINQHIVAIVQDVYVTSSLLWPLSGHGRKKQHKNMPKNNPYGVFLLLAPRKIPIKDTIIGIDAVARRLPQEDANDLCVRVCGILQKTTPPIGNITKNKQRH